MTCNTCSQNRFHRCLEQDKPVQLITKCHRWPKKRIKVLWLMGDFARGGCSRYTANLFPMLADLPIDFRVMYVDGDAFDTVAAAALGCPIEKLDVDAYTAAVAESDFVSATLIHEQIPGWQILLSIAGTKLFGQVHGTCAWSVRLIETLQQYTYKIMCCSPAVRLLVPPSVTTFVPPAPLDFRRMVRHQTKEAAKSSLGLSGFKVVTTASRISYDKNLLGTAELIKSLPEDFVWLCVGRGFAEQELYPQIKAMLGDRVRIISEWLNPPDYLDATDCFLCMSPNEGMPYTVIEALFHGTPVASTPVGIVPSLVLKKPGQLNRPLVFIPEDLIQAVEGYSLEEQAEIRTYMELRFSPLAVKRAWAHWLGVE